MQAKLFGIYLVRLPFLQSDLTGEIGELSDAGKKTLKLRLTDYFQL